MTDISKEAVDALCETHAGYLQHGTAATLQALRAALDEAEADRERFALAICGGEDVPGYANAASVEELEGIARKAASDHMATINMMLRAEAERDAANALLRRITRNVDADGVGTVLIIDLQAARAHLGAKP